MGKQKTVSGWFYWFSNGDNEAYMTTAYDRPKDADADRKRTLDEGRFASEVFEIQFPKLPLKQHATKGK
jgi:hypothetical protein